MANSKIKASVHVNEEDSDWENGIELTLTASQSAEVLKAVVAGATLSINLKTPVKGYGYDSNGDIRAIHEDPAAYAS